MIALGYGYEAGSVFVYAVHKAYAVQIVYLYLFLLQVVRQAIDKCPGIVAACRMHHHACRLIDDHEVFILVSNIQWYIFGYYFCTFLVAGLEYHYSIVRPHAVVRLYDFVIDQYETFFYGLLHLVTGSSFEAVHQEFIYAQGFLLVVCSYSQAFYRLVAGLGQLGFRFFIIPNLFYVIFIDHGANIVICFFIRLQHRSVCQIFADWVAPTGQGRILYVDATKRQPRRGKYYSVLFSTVNYFFFNHCSI